MSVEHHPSTVSHFLALVESAERLIGNGDYQEISYTVLATFNNQRGGWTPEVADLFQEPKTSYEQQLVARMAQIIIKTVDGLSKTAVPGKSFTEFSDIEFLALQLFRLQALAPADLVSRVKNLVIESRKLGAPPQYILAIPAEELLTDLADLLGQAPRHR